MLATQDMYPKINPLPEAGFSNFIPGQDEPLEGFTCPDGSELTPDGLVFITTLGISATSSLVPEFSLR